LGTEAPEAIKKRVMHELNIYNKTLQSTYLGMQNLLKNHQLAHLVFFQRKCGKDLMDGVISHYLELFKSVVQAIPIYVMSCFQISIGICDRMRSTVYHWWDFENGKKNCIGVLGIG
jgi:hypothetical protein